MDAIEMLQHDLQREKEKVREVLDGADADGRAVTPDERAGIKGHLDRMTEIKARIEDERDKAALREAVDGYADLQMAAQGIDANPVRKEAAADRTYRTPGEALAYSDFMKNLAVKVKSSGHAPRFNSPAVEVPWPLTKAAGDPVLESDATDLFGTGGAAGSYATLFGLETPGFLQPRLMIADLIPSVQITTGNAAVWPEVETRTAISGTPQTEGSAKPGGEYVFKSSSAALETIAGWVKVSTQFLEDAPAMAQYVNADLAYQVRFNEEVAVATALYTAAGAASAITGGSSEFDSILDAIVTIQLENADPNAVIIHPMDWAILRTEKFEAGTAGYVGGGPFSPTNNPWGLRVIVTPNATFGSPLVGDFTRARIFRRGGLSVAAGNDADDFTKNLVTVRAELRSVTVVTYPEAFAEASVSS